jgi:hypothetical protein
MVTILLSFTLLIGSLQSNENIKVGPTFVNSPYSNTIIFAYSHAAMPEDTPLRKGALDCMLSELKGTGLFTDVRAEMEPIEDGQKVKINITPIWHPRIEEFLINELVFEGFEGVDEMVLRLNLHQKRLPGVPLMRQPLRELLQTVEETMREVHNHDPQMKEKLDDMLLHLSFRVIVTAPERVRLTIISGHRPLCQRKSRSAGSQ